MNPQTTSGAAEPVPPQTNAYPMAFTGSGSTYFKVWIVNMLLFCLTLSLYVPWARNRTTRYFYSHTLVAGSPLEFTAQLRSMMLSLVLLIVLSLAFDIAFRTGPTPAVTLFLLTVAALVPLLWGYSMRLRFSATCWRGLRLQFVASWGDIYSASWPLYALLLWWGLYQGMQWLAPGLIEALSHSGSEAASQWPPAAGALLLAGLALTLACIARLEYSGKCLLARQTRLGAEYGRCKPVSMGFVRAWLGAVALLMLCLLGLLGVGMLLAMAVDNPPIEETVIPLLLLFLSSVPPRAYREARIFHTLWNSIAIGQVAHFTCRLSIRRYVLLRSKNMLLTLLTLGLYRPFARVGEYRMKLESVTVHVNGNVDQAVRAMLLRQAGEIDTLG